MCSRVYLDASLREWLARTFPFLEGITDLPAPSGKHRGDVSPTDSTGVIRMAANARPERIDASWGFVPPGDPDKKRQALFINARAETLLEKPLWRDAARDLSGRCVIPVSGFYEWPGGVRHKISANEGGGFLLAGLFSVVPFPTFTVITTAPSEEFAPFHHRMPAILDAAAARRWLTEPDPEKAAALLRPAPEGSLRAEESLTRPVQERLL